MKKTITILLSLMMIMCLVACGSSAGETENPSTGDDSAVSAEGNDAGSSDEDAQAEDGMTTQDSDAQAEAENTEQTDSADAGGAENADSSETQQPEAETPGAQGSKVLVAYFSATGTTKGVAQHIANGLNADIYEIVPEEPYTDADLNYNDNNSRSTIEMNDASFRPAISGSVADMEQYDVVFIGYPNWWASIPMPIASFLEEYDFSGKTIVPFCSHGGGRFGQSLTAIAKLVPDAEMGEALSVHYSGGSDLPDEIAEWLETNKVLE